MKTRVAALLGMLVLLTMMICWPAISTSQGLTCLPTPKPTSTPLTYYRCAVKISNVTTGSLTVVVWSNTTISGTYWININYSDPPCKPWKRDGAQVWIVDERLSEGDYTVRWLDHFSEPMSLGQEACINWMCKPGAGTPCVYVGQDYKTLFDYVYLPLILGGSK